MGKTKTKQEATEGQAIVFARRLGEERERTAFGTPTKAITTVLREIETYLASGKYKKDQFFKEEWTGLHYELTQLFNKVNADLLVANETGKTERIEKQEQLLALAVSCMNSLSDAAGLQENPSAILTSGEQPPQLSQLVASPRVFTGAVGSYLTVSLPDQFQQGISQNQQDEARLKLQNWYNAYVNNGNVKTTGKAFYDFLKANTHPKQFDTMLCGAAQGTSQCTQIKRLFENGNLGALMDGDYPISETLRTTRRNATEQTLYVISNVNVSLEAGYKLGDITTLGARATGEYQTVLERSRVGEMGQLDENYAHLFGAELSPFIALQLGPSTELRGSAGVGYGQMEQGVFFPAELKLSSSLGTTEGTALFFDIYGRGKFGLNLEEFRQLQAGADAYLILLQVGERQFGVFTSADLLNIKGKTGEFDFNITNLQLNVGPQFQTRTANGWLVAVKASPTFVFPIEGPEGTTYGMHLGTMFQKGRFSGGVELTSPNLFSYLNDVNTGAGPEAAPLAFQGNLILGWTFGPKQQKKVDE